MRYSEHHLAGTTVIAKGPFVDSRVDGLMGEILGTDYPFTVIAVPLILLVSRELPTNTNQYRFLDHNLHPICESVMEKEIARCLAANKQINR